MNISNPLIYDRVTIRWSGRGHPDFEMKSPLVHKFMRKHFITFLHEHGLERPFVPRVGVACTNHAGFHIKLGYKLSGYCGWTGNDIRLDGSISTLGRIKRTLQADIVQPDDLLPTALRSNLRKVALQQLSRISETARTNAIELPAFRLVALRKAEADHLYVPDFPCQTEKDLERWCAIVRPHIPECIKALKAEAEQLRADASF